jgi:hypothetical protein
MRVQQVLSRSRRRAGVAALALVAAAAAAVSGAAQWDQTVGDYHTHLIAFDDRFELHLHDKATHGIVETAKGRYKATLLSGGRSIDVPMQSKQAGIVTGARALTGDWTLLLRVEIPGRKPVQLRYSSKMKTGSQDASHKHDHGSDSASKH